MTNAKEITTSYSDGNSAKGHRVFWAYIDGKILRKSNGVGRTFKSEAAARKAAEAEAAS